MGLGILDPAVTMGQSDSRHDGSYFEEIGILDVKASKRDHAFNIGYPQMFCLSKMTPWTLWKCTCVSLHEIVYKSVWVRLHTHTLESECATVWELIVCEDMSVCGRLRTWLWECACSSQCVNVRMWMFVLTEVSKGEETGEWLGV